MAPSKGLISSLNRYPSPFKQTSKLIENCSREFHIFHNGIIQEGILTRWESLVVKVIGSEDLGSRQWKSILPQAAAPAAPLLAASINSIFTPSATNSTWKKKGVEKHFHYIGYLDRGRMRCNRILISRCKPFGEQSVNLGNSTGLRPLSITRWEVYVGVCREVIDINLQAKMILLDSRYFSPVKWIFIDR